MDTHPLWRRFEKLDLDDIARLYVSGEVPSAAPVEVVPPDPTWPAAYEQIATRVRRALGDRALELQHVGSTSVPGLWAKPVIDVDLIVADSADEPAYVPHLEQAGFTLTVREPDWEEHRCFGNARSGLRCHLHVFSKGAVEPRRHVAFREWLTTHAAEHAAYGDLKRGLATRGFDSTMKYNNEKAELIYQIYERIFAADPGHAHVPRPVGS